jgi:hypothetical protein
MQRIMRRLLADKMNGWDLQSWRLTASFLESFDLGQVVLYRVGQDFDVDPEMNRPVARDFFQSSAPQLDGTGWNSLLPFEIASGDLNDTLIKHSIITVILEPDLFQCFVTFEEELLIEFVDALKKAGIVLGFHCWCVPGAFGFSNRKERIDHKEFLFSFEIFALFVVKCS